MFNNNFKKLIIGKKRISGRTSVGVISIWHRGGGTKKNFRLIDYKKYVWNVPGIVLSLSFDPLRSTWLCLISFLNGIISYSLLPQSIGLGSIIESGFFSKCIVGNTFFLMDIPFNKQIFNIELYKNKGSCFSRSPGVFSLILGFFNNNKLIIKLPSKQLYYCSFFCIATIGRVSNFLFNCIYMLKAGKNRRLGKRPIVRGVAMNPVDHPHGGGEGKTSGGRPSVSPWGKITK